MIRDARLSDCGQYRYSLTRRWDMVQPALVFVMLNPSTATAEEDDPTIRRCIGFGQTLGFGSIEVVNLFAYRATRPADLKAAGWPVGPANDAHIAHAARAAVHFGGAVCCAWGSNADRLARPGAVLTLLRRVGAAPMCLERTRTGAPAHPLYLPGATQLRPFDRGC